MWQPLLFSIMVLMSLPVDPEVLSAKEQKEILSQIEAEAHEIREVLESPEVPRDVEAVEAVGGEITLPQPVTDDQGQIVLDNAAPQQVTVTLPLTEEEIERALHLKIVESFRWLAEWACRLLKKGAAKFVYKAE